ncbi:hypothetical protein BGZ54_007895 [Gamsiella multidivaricata]|nr:hypothetical protein BGZ54_007895 [Gamsiella multidivaricata]
MNGRKTSIISVSTSTSHDPQTSGPPQDPRLKRRNNGKQAEPQGADEQEVQIIEAPNRVIKRSRSLAAEPEVITGSSGSGSTNRTLTVMPTDNTPCNVPATISAAAPSGADSSIFADIARILEAVARSCN